MAADTATRAERGEIDAMLELRLESTRSETAEYRVLAGTLQMQVTSVREELDRMRADAAALGAKRDAARQLLVAARERRDSTRAARLYLERQVEAERKRFSSERITELRESGRELRAVEDSVAKATASAEELGRAIRQLTDEIDFVLRAKQRFSDGQVDEARELPSKAPGPRGKRMPPPRTSEPTVFKGQLCDADLPRARRREVDHAMSNESEPARETRQTANEAPALHETTPGARREATSRTHEETSKAMVSEPVPARIPVHRSQVVTIRVVDRGAAAAPETFYRARRTRPLKSVVVAHAKRKGVRPSAIVFALGGRVLDRYDASPDDLGLPDLAVLECSLRRAAKPSDEASVRVLSYDDGRGAFGAVSSETAIVLAVRDARDASLVDVYYTIEEDDRLERVFLAHASHLKLPATRLSFYTDGGLRQILEAQTPKELGLTDLAQILCVQGDESARR